MIESFIEAGAKGPNDNIYGKSITDPCLGWDETKKVLHRVADAM